MARFCFFYADFDTHRCSDTPAIHGYNPLAEHHPDPNFGLWTFNFPNPHPDGDPFVDSFSNTDTDSGRAGAATAGGCQRGGMGRNHSESC
jgi:hypothetical protein